MTDQGLRSYPVDDSNPQLDRVVRLAGLAGLAALALFVVGGFLAGFQDFFISYLFAYLFWLELTLGGLAVAMLHYLVGGGWGMMVRRAAEAAAKNIWVMAVLFIPVVLGMRYLFPWTLPEYVAGDPVVQEKVAYLNIPFFLVRAVVYFGVWSVLTFTLTRWANRPEYSRDLEARSRLQRRGAFGLIAYGLTMSFAAIDWIMSLDPHWYSSIYGMLIITGQMLGGLALVILLTVQLARRTPLGEVIHLRHYRDLGAMLFSFVIVWAYIAFSQYIIIWWANLPHEVTWYLDRTGGGWMWVGIGVFMMQFTLPFLVLLSVTTKRSPRVLTILTIVILATRLVDYFWHVVPAFSPGQFTLHWMDLLAPLALGGIWAAAFAWNLKRTPLILPVNPEPPPRFGTEAPHGTHVPRPTE